MRIGAVVRIACALAAAFAAAGCVRAVRAPAPQLFSAPELDALVTGRTLRVLAGGGWEFETLLFLGPGSKGWLDERLVPGMPPLPGDMAMVFEWGIAPGSRICVWAAPLIGQMPNFAPPGEQCLQILRTGVAPQGLAASVERGEGARTAPLELLPGDAFPPAAIDQYLEQVRVLYGGRIPAWSHP